MEFTVFKVSNEFEQKRDIKSLDDLRALQEEFGHNLIVSFEDHILGPHIYIYDYWME
jgi:hypothetical protein